MQEVAAEMEKACIDYYLNENYTYQPSNYSLNEINAYQAQLEGAKNGYYVLSEADREDIQARIEHNTNDYNRAKEYENTHGYNSDGTKK